MKIKKIGLYFASFAAYALSLIFGGFVIWASVLSLNPFIAVPGIMMTAVHFAGCEKLMNMAINHGVKNGKVRGF